jgi:hypothetical protein
VISTFHASDMFASRRSGISWEVVIPEWCGILTSLLMWHWLPRVTLIHEFCIPNVPNIPWHLSPIDWATHRLFLLPHVSLLDHGFSLHGFGTSWIQDFCTFISTFDHFRSAEYFLPPFDLSLSWFDDLFLLWNFFPLALLILYFH